MSASPSFRNWPIAAMADANNRMAQSSAGYAEELKQLADGLEQRVSRFNI